MPTKKIIIFVFIFFSSFSQFVLAKTNNNKSELTVEADESLEWFEKEKYYLAKGKVILKKDGVTLKANTVKADYVLQNGENILKKIIAKEKKIRSLVHKFQQKCAYSPPTKYSGSILDGRDITSIQMKNAMFKFYITANVRVRATRRYREYKALKKKISFDEVLKSLKKRDKSDKNRKYGPLKKTKDSILINTTKLSRRRCFEKIKAIMDRKIKLNGNIQ